MLSLSLKNNLNIYSGPYQHRASLVQMPLWTTCYLFCLRIIHIRGDWINRNALINTCHSAEEFYHLTNLWSFLQSHTSNVNQVKVQMSSQVCQDYLNTLDNITNLFTDSPKMEREEVSIQRSQNCCYLRRKHLFALYKEPSKCSQKNVKAASHENKMPITILLFFSRYPLFQRPKRICVYHGQNTTFNPFCSPAACMAFQTFSQILQKFCLQTSF